MARENVERLREAFEAFLAGKSGFGTELVHPEIEWDATGFSVPDIGGVYRGERGFGSSGESGLIVRWKAFMSQLHPGKEGLTMDDKPANSRASCGQLHGGRLSPGCSLPRCSA